MTISPPSGNYFSSFIDTVPFAQFAKGALILPVNTLMQKVCPADFLTSHALVMAKGDKLSVITYVMSSITLATAM